MSVGCRREFIYTHEIIATRFFHLGYDLSAESNATSSKKRLYIKIAINIKCLNTFIIRSMRYSCLH
jgi:hypothetical protein